MFLGVDDLRKDQSREIRVIVVFVGCVTDFRRSGDGFGPSFWPIAEKFESVLHLFCAQRREQPQQAT